MAIQNLPMHGLQHKCYNMHVNKSIKIHNFLQSPNYMLDSSCNQVYNWNLVKKIPGIFYLLTYNKLHEDMLGDTANRI